MTAALPDTDTWHETLMAWGAYRTGYNRTHLGYVQRDNQDENATTIKMRKPKPLRLSRREGVARLE